MVLFEAEVQFQICEKSPDFIFSSHGHPYLTQIVSSVVTLCFVQFGWQDPAMVLFDRTGNRYTQIYKLNAFLELRFVGGLWLHCLIILQTR